MLRPAKAKTDARHYKREKVLQFAHLSTNPKGIPGHPCILKDLTPEGCQVVGTGAEAVEDVFYLSVEGLGDPRKCEVIWRKKNMIGGRFVEALPAGLALQVLARLPRLEDPTQDGNPGAVAPSSISAETPVKADPASLPQPTMRLAMTDIAKI